MRTCMLHSLLVVALTATVFTSVASAQEVDVPLAGPTGQVVSAASPGDVAHFGAATLFSQSFALWHYIGVVVQGISYGFRVQAGNCPMRVMVVIVGTGNSTAVSKSTARGANDVTVNFTARRTGIAFGVANARTNMLCQGFADVINNAIGS